MNKPNHTGKSKNQSFTVTGASELMTFLIQSMPNKSRNNIKAMLAHQEIRVDGEIVTKYNHPLTEGQSVRIMQSILRDRTSKLIPTILYEDDELIVVDKPAGLLSIATEKEKEFTAYHMLFEYVKRQNPNGRIYIVHRLDKDTSGILMVSKDEELKKQLQDNWNELVIKRGYTAVVEGKLKEKQGRLESYLRETKTHIVYSAKDGKDGLKAITNYSVIKEKGAFSLLDISLETGRKNQIRVQMNDIGHPVVGDKKYGSTKDPIKRLGLHAGVLEFVHPVTGKKLSFTAKLPSSFKALFKL